MREIVKMVREQETVIRAGEFAHYAFLLGKAGGDQLQAMRFAEAKGTPSRVAEILKSAVSFGTTTDANWASTLVAYETVAAGFVESLRNIGAFDSMLGGGMRVLPMRSNIATLTAVASGYNPGQGSVKTVSRFSLAGAQLDEQKAVSYVVVSSDLFKAAQAGMAFIATELRRGVVQSTDSVFLAGLANGVSAHASAGNTAANVLADLKTLLGDVTTDSTSRLYIVMDSDTVKGLSTIATTTGAQAFSDVTPQGGSILNIPIVVSDVLPLASGGSQVMLVDATGIAGGSSTVTLDASEQATLELDSAPTSPPNASIVTTSLWQMNKRAMRAERYFGFEKYRDTSVAMLKAVNW